MLFLPLVLFFSVLVIFYAFILPEGIRDAASGAVVFALVVLVLVPAFARARENRRWPEREAKSLDAHFARVRPQGNQAILTPSQWGWSDAYHQRSVSKRRLPFTLKVGSPLGYRSADFAYHLVVQGFTPEGIVFDDGRNMGPVLLPWK